MVNNPGRAINDRDIGKLFSESYNRAATVGNAISFAENIFYKLIFILFFCILY